MGNVDALKAPLETLGSNPFCLSSVKTSSLLERLPRHTFRRCFSPLLPLPKENSNSEGGRGGGGGEGMSSDTAPAETDSGFLGKSNPLLWNPWNLAEKWGRG